jgi:hypothetical protein
MILEQINPRFRFGESNENFCDCAGLVLFYLRSEGFKCSWEEQIVRLPTSYDRFEEQMRENKFAKSLSTNFDGAVMWKNPDGTGHIGVLYEGKIYHMMSSGIQVRLYQNEQIWFYYGN